MTQSSRYTFESARSAPNRPVTAEVGVFPTEYEPGRFYLMAVCPRYQVLVPVLEQAPEPLDETLGWWRCQVCLEWHLFLVSE
jgi:hypothetical protein